MKLLCTISLIFGSFFLPLQAKDKHLWIQLSAEVQNLRAELKEIGDETSPDPAALNIYLKKIDTTLDNLVKSGELEAHTITVKTPPAGKMIAFYESSIAPLKKSIDRIGKKYGIYTAQEMCDLGARLRILTIKPNSTFTMRIRLPKDEMRPYLADIKKLGLIKTLPELAEAPKKKPILTRSNSNSHWCVADQYAKRVVLLIQALDAAEKYSHLPYKFGSADPKNGGFDCSGAASFVMKNAGLKPPRTSAQQFIWIRDAGKIQLVGKKVTSLKHESFNSLTPGDLLFWTGTYTPTDGRKVSISHVGIYLGTEKDGRPIMACATNGRSYRGKKGNGYGIYDFKLPSKKSKATFVGYGPPM